MKIGILTQPLIGNYGGVLQNYALQTMLKRLGHKPYTIFYGQNNLRSWLLFWAKYIIKAIIRRPQATRCLLYTYLSNIKCENFYKFIRRNINITKPMGWGIDASKVLSYNFDGYVVGSDQTWRVAYNSQSSLDAMFLDFAKGIKTQKKISYSASFGIDYWEFTPVQTEKYKELIKLFDAVSVREQSGVTLCKQYFDIEAQHLLDPTMLLSADDYREVVKKSGLSCRNKGGVLVYVLDMNDEKQNFINEFCKQKGVTPFFVGKEDEKGVLPSIESWLDGFDSADYVITDSFHGSVFSIIFNKPFISIGNKARGLSRFNSLLSIFNLENRLIDLDNLQKIPQIEDPDWNSVISIMNEWQDKSITFLKTNLNN